MYITLRRAASVLSLGCHSGLLLTSGMQAFYSTKFCKSVRMNHQALLTCLVRFKIFYRRSVKVRHRPLKHSCPCYSHIQSNVHDGVDNLRSAARVFV